MSVPPSPEAGALARLIDPLPRAAFFERHWEREPLHVARGRAAHFADLVSIDAVERALSRGEPRHPDVQLVRGGAPVPPESYTDASGRVLGPRAAHHHRGGATLVLSGAHRAFDPLAELVRGLGQELGWRCQANAYLSPPGEGGFAPHHDTHDVFVLQVAGAKRFRFHTGGVDLPFPDERYDPALAPEREALESVELEAGDTLYIPRGVAHDAVAGGHASSLHVTVGVFPAVLRDLLVEAVQVAAEGDVALRRSVPREAWESGDGRLGPALVETLRGALEAALAGGAAERALVRLRDAATLDAVPDATGSLALAETGDPPAPETDTVLVADPHTRAERSGDTVRLRRPGEVIELAEPAASAAEDLFARGRVAVGALAGLEPHRARSLAARLLALGACRAER